MGGVLKCPFSVILKWNGIGRHDCTAVPRNLEDHRACGAFCDCLALTTDTIHKGTCQIRKISTSTMRQAHLSFGLSKLPPMSLESGSCETIRSFVGLNAVASHVPAVACKEAKETPISGSQDDGPHADFFSGNLPPWGNFTSSQEPDNDLESVSQFPTRSKNVVPLNENRVRCLDETNEEELSRRILVLSRSNKVRSALHLFKSMEFSGLRANAHACNGLLSCLLRKKWHENAMRFFQFMKTNELTTSHTYSLILKAIADSQDCDAAIAMFEEIEGFAKKSNSLDIIVYNTMISICGRVNNWVETERIWRKLKENDYHGTTITYCLLVTIFVRCCQNELALDAYHEMVKNGLNPRVDAMQAAIGACTKEGKWDLALSIFQNMLSQGLKPNLVACNTLINALGKSGRVNLAFDVFEKLKSLGHAPDAYTWNGLLGSLYKANQYANSLQLFERIKEEQSSDLNEHLYNTALMSCQKIGSWERALQILWQMEASGLSVSTSSYNIVLGACETARQPKVALEVYEHMIHQKCPPDAFTYLSLLRACIWASLWNEVQEIIDQAAPDVSLYNAVIHGMCLRGKVESAKKMYMKMRHSGLTPDGKTRALMLQNLRKGSAKRRRPSYFSHPR